MIHSVSEAVPDLLRAVGIRVERLGVSDDADVWRQTVAATSRLAEMQHRPIVTIFEALHPSLATSR
jgi:hypothetical protein